MSSTIQFSNIVKRYGDNTIVPNLNLTIRDGELFTLLGPSGCGKTTILRMVAGFNSIEGGTIHFGERKINSISPDKRNIGMVFQNYAIFPHMTVGENVAFGLKNRKIPKAEIQTRVDKILNTVQIQELRDRHPHNMSGGQQQRVALARAIVIHPDVLLMDEPLSNLDAKLRLEMRDAIREVQRQVGITTIYVTHDQEEAMAISDRIGILDRGVLQHVGTPENIYHRPANAFVATFIGRSNLVPAALEQDNAGNYKLVFDNGYNRIMETILPSTPAQPVQVGIRPEEFILSSDGVGIKGTVVSSVFLGLHTHYKIQLESGLVVESVEESGLGEVLQPGQTVYMQLKIPKINVFDSSGDNNLVEGVHNDAEK